MNEQRRILDMLAAGQLTPDEANDLLNALNTAPAPASKPSRPAQLLRIVVETEDEDRTQVNVPLGLAKFASQFIPHRAQEVLKNKGVNLSALLNALEHDLPEGRLVDFEAEVEGRQVKIVIEVS